MPSATLWKTGFLFKKNPNIVCPGSLGSFTEFILFSAPCFFFTILLNCALEGMCLQDVSEAFLYEYENVALAVP